MKKLLPILSLLIIISCSKEIQLDQLVERNGLSYEVNNEKPFTGSTLSYYSNDQLESRIEYKDGLKDGLSETFNKNGQIIKSENYKENVLNGLYKSFHENGQLRVKVILKNELPIDGQVEYFFENGSVYERSIFKDGKENGLVESFYEDGTLKYKHNYKDGKKEGIGRSFKSDGDEYTWSPECYKNDKEIPMSNCQN